LAIDGTPLIKEEQVSGNVPTIMVSSTFYDLREIRQQLALFIEGQLGYRALISESHTFPVDPTADAIENCRRRVEQDADVLVLLIGSRYGSIDLSSGYSVTNLEYLSARVKGIPIYAFIEAPTLALYDAWRVADGTAREAIGGAVDSAKLFDFIDAVRRTDGVWTFPFDSAAVIIDTLRAQMAYQTQAGLLLERRVRTTPERELLSTLSGHAFRTTLERPSGWEYLLFAQVLRQEINSQADLRRVYDHNISFGAVESVDELEFLGWSQSRLAEATRLSEAAGQLVNVTLQEAFGLPGITGSAPNIVFVARQLGRVYREAIEWALRVRRVQVTRDGFSELIQALSVFTGEMITKVGGWALSLQGELEVALAEARNRPAGSGPSTVQFTLVLSDNGTSAVFIAAMHSTYRRLGIVLP
jgi:hypothetical protein